MICQELDMMDVKEWGTLKEGKLGGYGLRHAVFEVKKRRGTRGKEDSFGQKFAQVARTESRGMQMVLEGR